MATDQDSPRSDESALPYVELNAFLRNKGLAQSGGLVKHAIRSGKVKVNGVSETRNKRKLHAGDVVEHEGKSWTVEATHARMRNKPKRC